MDESSKASQKQSTPLTDVAKSKPPKKEVVVDSTTVLALTADERRSLTKLIKYSLSDADTLSDFPRGDFDSFAQVLTKLQQAQSREGANHSAAVHEKVKGITIFFDGGCNPNPGQMTAGVHCPETGYELSHPLGYGTNNVAEWTALKLALEYATSLRKGGYEGEVTIKGDSSLVINGIRGVWRVKHSTLKPIYEECKKMAGFGIGFMYTPRERNAIADRLTRR